VSNAVKVYDSAYRNKFVITNEGSITVEALAHLNKTISFTVTTANGKPALRDIKGISIGVGFLKKDSRP
jgi:hypothetical protein